MGGLAIHGVASDAQSRIGPNAIIRLLEALQASVGGDRARDIFERAGQARHLATPPVQMVDEADVNSLYTLLPAQLGSGLAAEVSQRAGRLTGDYLLAHRIPHAVQQLLHWLPAPVAARVLLGAIQRHAWTFVGSGVFIVEAAPRLSTEAGRTAALNGEAHAQSRPRLLLRVERCPICRGSAQAAPGCSYYAATFERIFAVLVHPHASVHESACAAMGASACVFEVRW